MNWWDRISDIKKRDVPYFVMYELPEESVDSELCWEGDLFWEEERGRFREYHERERNCRTIERTDVSRRLFGVRVRPDRPLSIELFPSGRMGFWQGSARALEVLTCLTVVSLSVAIRLGTTLLGYVLILASAAATGPDGVARFAGYPDLPGGSDGLAYEMYARDIVQHFVNGEFRLALMGSEKVFYFMPGLRYFIAIGKPVFGDTGFVHLVPLLLLPVFLFFLTRRFWPTWASFLAVGSFLFVEIPFLAEFAWQHSTYEWLASIGLAEPLGYALFLAAVPLLLRDCSRDRSRSFHGTLWLGASLFALSVMMRPNLSLPVGVILTIVSLRHIRKGNWKAAVDICLGALPILLIPLHNLYYGGEYRLFTQINPVSYSAPPRSYLAAFEAVLSGGEATEDSTKVINQIRDWSGNSGTRVGTGALVLAGILWPAGLSWPMRALGLATLSMHAPLLFFYDPGGRASYLAWNLTGFLGIAVAAEYLSVLGPFLSKTLGETVGRLLNGRFLGYAALLVLSAPLCAALLLRLPGPLAMDLEERSGGYLEGFKRDAGGDAPGLETRRLSRARIPATVTGPGVLRLRLVNPTPDDIEVQLAFSDGTTYRMRVVPGGPTDVRVELPPGRVPAEIEIEARPPRLRVIRLVWEGVSWPDIQLCLVTAAVLLGIFLVSSLLGTSAGTAAWVATGLLSALLLLTISGIASPVEAIGMIDVASTLTPALVLCIVIAKVFWRFLKRPRMEPRADAS
jgi:hypothetical protein